MQPLTATRLLSIPDVLSGWDFRSASAGPDGEVLVLASEHAPENLSRAGRTKQKRARPSLAYRIYAQQGNQLSTVDLPPTLEQPYFVQPLGPDQWLTATARSSGAYNAHVYSSAGQRLRSLHLGDAIEDVQTTKAGQIWTSYFDEGVFGDEMLGQQGSICFNQLGQPIFTYNDLAEQKGLSFIADCYAMNVCSDVETWLYFYTDFPLVRIVRGQIERIWNNIPVHGAQAFAISEQHALFAGRYHQRHSLFLMTLGTFQVEEAQPIDDQGTAIRFVAAFARGSLLYMRDEQALFSIDLAQLEA